LKALDDHETEKTRVGGTKIPLSISLSLGSDVLLAVEIALVNPMFRADVEESHCVKDEPPLNFSKAVAHGYAL